MWPEAHSKHGMEVHSVTHVLSLDYNRRMRSSRNLCGVAVAVCNLSILSVSLAGATGPLGCADWRVLNPLPVAEDLHGVALAAGGRLAAVGDAGTILESAVGLVWQPVASGTDEDLWAIDAVGDRLVAVGDGGTIVVSDSAGSWRGVAPAVEADLRGVAVGPDGLLAVGAFGTVLWSAGGETWAAALVGEDDLAAATWFDDRWIVVGAAGAAYGGTPSAGWQSLMVGIESDLVGAAAIDGLVIVGGDHHEVAGSTDGLTWTWQVPWGGPDVGRWAIASCEGEFLTVYGRQGTAAGRDLDRWTGSSSPRAKFRMEDVVCTPGGAVGVGPGGHIGLSADRWQWRDVSGLGGLDLKAVASDGDRQVMAGTAGTTSGRLWRQGSDAAAVSSWDTSELRDALWDIVVGGNGQEVGFVAVGVGHNPFDNLAFVYWSRDGLDFESTFGGYTFWPHAVTWNGARWIAADPSGGLASSADGRSWERASPAASLAGVSAIAANLDAVVVVTGGGSTAMSQSGASWAVTDHAAPGGLESVVWTGERWVAVGDEGALLTSVDGMIWSAIESGTRETLRRAAVTPWGIVVVGDGGVVLTSADGGTTWQSEVVAPGHDLLSVTAHGDRVTAVGASELILEADCRDESSQPRAAFAWRPVSPRVDQPTRLWDLSTGEVAAWDWDLGDGAMADGPVIEHAWGPAGSYDVGLSVEGPTGQDTASARIDVTPPCSAPAPPTISAPDVVASGDLLAVSWTHPLEGVEFRLDAGPSPQLDDDQSVLSSTGNGTTSPQVLRIPEDFTGRVWIRGRVFRDCGDVVPVSEWSDTIEVVVEPSLDRAAPYGLLLPVAAHTAGVAGTDWRTDVSLVAGERPARTTFGLLPWAGSSASATLRARGSGLVEDVVGQLGAGDLRGGVVIASDQPLVVSSRTFSGGADGTFGQAVPAIPIVALPEGRARLLDLEESPDFRTNLGVTNPSDTSVTVESTFVGPDGEYLGWRKDTLPPGGHVQLNRVLAGVANGPLTAVTAELVVDPPGAEMAVYASVVDNRSGDASLRMPVASDSWRTVAGPQLPPVSGQARWNDVVATTSGVVAVGAAVATWSPGLPWSLHPVADGVQTLAVVAAHGDEVVAFGRGVVDIAAVGTSADGGETWSWVDVADLPSADLAWAGDRWIAVGRALGVSTSVDGRTWDVTRPGGDDLEAVVWTGSEVVAVGEETVLVSTDDGWERVTIAGAGLRDIAWSGHELVTAGDAGLMWSTDGHVWQPVGDLDSMSEVTWTGTQFLAWGHAEGLLHSRDGRVWRQVPLDLGSAYVWGLLPVADAVLVTYPFGQIRWIVPSQDDVLIPSVASVTGAADTDWRSRVALRNGSGDPLLCELAFLERDRDNAQPLTTTIDLPSRSVVTFDDVVESPFGSSTAGALRLSCDGPGLEATSRTFTPRGEGTMGQLVPALPDSALVQPFEVGVIPGLIESGDSQVGARTNLGIVSQCHEPASFRLSLVDRDGRVAWREDLELPAAGVVQVDGVLRGVVDQDRQPAAARIEVVDSWCPFAAWASTVDNRSGDPSFVVATPIAATTLDVSGDGLSLANDRALLVDRLDQAVGTAELPAGNVVLSADGVGALGGADRPLVVLCTWNDRDGRPRYETLRTGQQASGVAGGGPLWCVVPDVGTCADNVGRVDLRVEVGGDEIELSLDAAENCVDVASVDGAASMMPTESQFRFRVWTTGDLGAAEAEPVLLLMQPPPANGWFQSARVLRDGDLLYPSRSFPPEWFAVVLDRGSRDDNTGSSGISTF